MTRPAYIRFPSEQERQFSADRSMALRVNRAILDATRPLLEMLAVAEHDAESPESKDVFKRCQGYIGDMQSDLDWLKKQVEAAR